MHDVYLAQNDSRSAMQQIEQGWLLKYNPKTSMFYTFDPAREAETFGSRSMSKSAVRAKVKKEKLEQVDRFGEIFQLKTYGRLI